MTFYDNCFLFRYTILSLFFILDDFLIGGFLPNPLEVPIFSIFFFEWLLLLLFRFFELIYFPILWLVLLRRLSPNFLTLYFYSFFSLSFIFSTFVFFISLRVDFRLQWLLLFLDLGRKDYFRFEFIDLYEAGTQGCYWTESKSKFTAVLFNRSNFKCLLLCLNWLIQRELFKWCSSFCYFWSFWLLMMWEYT